MNAPEDLDVVFDHDGFVLEVPFDTTGAQWLLIMLTLVAGGVAGAGGLFAVQSLTSTLSVAVVTAAAIGGIVLFHRKQPVSTTLRAGTAELTLTTELGDGGRRSRVLPWSQIDRVVRVDGYQVLIGVHGGDDHLLDVGALPTGSGAWLVEALAAKASTGRDRAQGSVPQQMSQLLER